MATRFREFDWAATPLGPVDEWPESWRNAVRIILDSSFPTALAIGAKLIYFYNDAFIPVGGPARHPSALGSAVPVVWKEIWEPILEQRFKHTLTTGEPTGEQDLMMPLERSGYLEETYITFSFAALRDEQERPNGIFCTAYETTARVLADRQLNCLRALATRISGAETAEEACQSAAATLADYPRDLPFAAIYLADGDGQTATLAGLCGPSYLAQPVPACITLSGDLENLAGSPALSLPISGLGGERLAGLLLAGINPMRPTGESRKFFELVASQLETAIANARAKQHVRERAQALADLDRAKTLFFSNISHELRTPLTLLLGPVNDVLTRGALAAPDRELLEIANRGGRRLLKLVNSLLEFSRIEAGRVEASYEPADLAALTTDLASVFRSAFERAGVALTIDCPTLPEPIYVDADMWEKIVLNLVSNAFKFTFQGEVCVRLRLHEHAAELHVIDTGCGVAADDLPRLFDRFFRGRSTRTRTHEGSGIGLSLVQELVKLHAGSTEAHSQPGHGTSIAVRIPRGHSHLPQDRIGAARKLARADTGTLPFMEEALGWLPGPSQGASAGTVVAATAASTAAPSAAVPALATAPRLLVVDDNADMRDYLSRLLGQRWRIETASNGAAALEMVERSPPDLVIADVMMPGIDGFGLLRMLRHEARHAEIPVMLLSARAGEEASSEALSAGADDYVIKPFSARELLARVESRLTQARLRSAERHARQLAEHANRARDEFFAMLSHELRTPLTAVLAWIEQLKVKRLDADSAAALEIIESNARIQKRLVNDLLDMSRIVTGQLRIDARPLPSLADIVRGATDSLLPVASERGITLESQLEARAGPVLGDPERLQQVVWNLLSNALRCTPRGGRIEVDCRRRDDGVTVTVRDSGCGIAADSIPHLFDRYWKGQPGAQPLAASEPGKGLGLGLTIAKSIVALHSGTITALSEGPGRGATFIVRLPVTAAIAETPPERKNSAEPRALRVLLVEDHDAIAKACQRLLSAHGHTVTRTADLKSATSALESAPFDVLICDLNLPDGSGLELPARARALAPRHSQAQPPPAIAISGRVYEDDVGRCLDAGFIDHLPKPFDERELLEAIGRATGTA